MGDWTQVGQAMDTPDSVGWFAFEGRFDLPNTPSTFRSAVEVIDVENSLEVYVDGSLFSPSDLIGEYTRLHMPWEAQPGNPLGAVGASVPRRVDKAIRAGLRRERVNIEMSDLSPGHLASELADVDAALAWLGQQKGDGDDNH